jgi:hypothetical protein
VKRSILLSILFVIATIIAFADAGSPLAELNLAIKNKALYTRQKQQRIDSLKKLKVAGISLAAQYQINGRLYEEYKKYRIDTAVLYALQNQQIGKKLQGPDLISTAEVQLANLYSSSGKFLESENILKGINIRLFNKSLVADYYDARIQFYEHYATNSYDELYVKLIQVYRDSLLQLLEPSSAKYKTTLAQKLIYQQNLLSAQKEIRALLHTSHLQSTDYAMATYLLALTYRQQQQPDSARRYYALSALTDVKNAIKDNASLQNLALMFYQNGDVDQAYQYTQSAIEDAIFSNVKFRTLHMSELYSIINTAYLEKEAKQKSQLQGYLVLISVLTVGLVVTLIYIYRQMRKVSRIKDELQLTGKQLAELNQQITETNVQLYEANQVKEAYIAQFFDLCSAYITKLEDYRKSLNKKATENRLEELFKMLRSTTVVDNELDELYHVFDSIFLNLYPNFISEFNALLLPDEHIAVKPGALLNTELRIFALMRLGITDSVKIAAFLRCSLSTIYNYRTRARNKSAVPRDDFEKSIMKIGLLPFSVSQLG